MFSHLSERLSQATRELRGKGRLTEENISSSLRQVRMALLEADVALPVVKSFIASVQERALGAEVSRSLTPGQAFIQIVRDELVTVMGEPSAGINLRAQPPVVLLLAGLQGTGKTTTAAKLARWLIKEGHQVMLVSVDIHRPAAILQLERLAEQAGATFFPARPQLPASQIALEALAAARRAGVDVVIIDTAGRLHIDEAMMTELAAVCTAVQPTETLFVVDSMVGQDAVNAARRFNETLELSGVILTKTDGDARGGAALSVRTVTGKPVKFLGTGEKLDGLELFQPDRVASRILGMGDVLSLVEHVEEQADKKKAERLAKKLKKGKSFDLNDLKEQLQQMLEMGGLAGILEKLPAGANLPAGIADQADDRRLRHQIAMIDSMTPRERRSPRLIDGSRKRRIATGAGRPVQELNRLLKQFGQMQKMMKKFSRGGMGRLMLGMKGRMPPGFNP